MAIFEGPWRWRHFAFGTLVGANILLCVFPPNLFFHRFWAMHAHHWMLFHFGLTFVLLGFKEYRMMTANVLACASLAFFLRRSFEFGQMPRFAGKPEVPPVLKVALFQYRPTAAFIETVLLAKADLAFVQQCPDTAVFLEQALRGAAYHSQRHASSGGPNTVCFTRSPLVQDSLGGSFPPDLLRFAFRVDSLAHSTVRAYCLWLPPAEAGHYNEILWSHARALSGTLPQGPAFVCGNLHNVPWSKDITAFRDTLRLFDSRHDLTGGLFGIPEDHIFYTDHWICTKFKSVRSSNGTDMGIMGYYQLKPEFRRYAQTPTAQF
jgi:hypothetical protein